MKILQQISGSGLLVFVMVLTMSFTSLAGQPHEPQAEQSVETSVNNETEAQDVDDKKSTESFWELDLGFVVGFGKASMDSLNQSRHGNLIQSAWLSGGYYNGNFFVETDPANGKPLTVGYTAFESDTLQVNFIGTPFYLGFEQDSQVRGNYLDGIDDRNTSFDGGMEVLSSHDFGQIGFRALHDVSGTHQGYALAAVYGYPVYFDKMVVWPSVVLTYASADANNFYYGIEPHEARPNRPAYQADGGFVAKLNLYVEYELTERSSMIGYSHYALTDSNIHQSPLISRNYSFAVGLGMIWTF